jgi:hypothetical protein
MTDCTHLTPLQLAQEAYINVYKSEYGIKPRSIPDELWNDIEWLERQLQYLAQEAEVHEAPAELGYFEELLANLEPSDYE